MWLALARFGAPLDALKIRQSDFAAPDTVAQFGLPPYRVDVMTGVSGVSFTDAWAGRLQGEMLGTMVPFLGRDAFVRNKRASGRPKDLMDLDALGER